MRQLFGSVDEAAALDGLRRRAINYDPALAPEDGRADGHWHVDSGEEVIGREPPGPPVPGGPGRPLHAGPPVRVRRAPHPARCLPGRRPA